MTEPRKGPRERETGSPIAAARIRANLTQEQLAEKLCCQKQTISRWERGEYSPNAKMLVKMSQILNCTVQELI